LSFQAFDAAIWISAGVFIGILVAQRRWWLTWFLAGWLAASIMGLASGGHFRGHYFIQALPPLCLASAMRWNQFERRFAWLPVLMALWVLAGPLHFGKSPERQSCERYCSLRFVNAMHVGSWLRDIGSCSVYILGSEPEIHHYSGVRAVTRYVISNPLFGGFPSSRQRQQEVRDALERDLPTHIIVGSPNDSIPMFPQSDSWLFDEVLTILREHYSLTAVTYCRTPGIFDATFLDEVDPGPVDMAIYSRNDHGNEQSLAPSTPGSFSSDAGLDVSALRIRLEYGARAALACVFAGIAVWQVWRGMDQSWEHPRRRGCWSWARTCPPWTPPPPV
jgi:hypothetical protein